MTGSTELVRRSTMYRDEVSLEDIEAGKHSELNDAKRLSKLVLKWEPHGRKSCRTDIGSYCYSERFGSGTWVSVNPQSLISHELLPTVVWGTLKLLVDDRNATHPVSLGLLARVLGADRKSELRSARDIYRRFNLLLRTEKEESNRSMSGLVNLDKAAISILCYGFDVSRESLLQGIGYLKYTKQPLSETRALSRIAAESVARSAADHFLTLTTALLENRPLPFPIEVNERKYLVTACPRGARKLQRYLPLDDAGHPPKNSVYGPDLMLRKLPSPSFGGAYPDDVVRRMKCRSAQAHNENRRLEAANDDKSSTTQRRLIADALFSFSVYTYFDTGANVSTLQGRVREGRQSNAINVSDIVDGDGKVILTRERGAKGYILTTQKPRAGNKEIPVVFSTFWVKRILPKYLLLRDHLLNLGCLVPTTLIFLLPDPLRKGLEVNSNPSVIPKLGYDRTHLLSSVLRANGLERLSTHMIRNYKTAALTREHGLQGSAKLMGHEIETSARHYNQVEEAEAQLQISNGINKLVEIAIISAVTSRAERLPGGGACTKSNSSVEITTDSEELGLHGPDCRTRTGCWMCPHFAVHADKEDLWKMKSYLFVIEELRANSTDPRGVAAVHNPIVKRLTGLCERIIAHDDKLAEAALGIDQLVDDGGLHPIYRSLLNTYEQVNLI